MAPLRKNSPHSRANTGLIPKLFSLTATAAAVRCQETKVLGPDNFPYHYPKSCWERIGVSYTWVAVVDHFVGIGDCSPAQECAQECRECWR